MIILLLFGLIAAAFIAEKVIKLLVRNSTTSETETQEESNPTTWTVHELTAVENNLLDTFARWDNKAIPDAQRSQLLCHMFTRQELPAYITKEYTGNPELVRTLIAASVELRSVD